MNPEPDFSIRLVILGLLCVSLGEMAIDLVRSYRNDHGWPWRPASLNNQRRHTDSIVIGLIASMSMITGVAAVALLLDGFAGHRTVVTVLLGVIFFLVVTLRWSAWRERKARRKARRQ